jgi:hypothetical protein
VAGDVDDDPARDSHRAVTINARSSTRINHAIFHPPDA